MKKIISLGLKIIVFVSGLLCLWFGLKNIFVDTSDWIKVQAEVISVSTSTDFTEGSNGISYDGKYKYQVDNIQYEGSYSNGPNYSPGKMITVYYDPQKPEISDVSPGQSQWFGIVLFLFGIYCIGSLGWAVLKSWFTKKGNPENPAEKKNLDIG